MKGDLEAYEGMLITIPTTLTVVEMFNLDRFGEIGLSSDGRLYQFTQQNMPDQAGFSDHLEEVATNFVMLDDGFTFQNPDPIRYPDGELDSADSLRMGDTVTGLTGVVRYSRGNGGSGDATYRIMPTADP
ncbi:MAG: endonuclease/exonuclease/phosphatase, partial [Planctomycetota bacterium]